MSISIPANEYQSSKTYSQLLMTFRDMVSEEQYKVIKERMVENNKHYYALDKFSQGVYDIKDMQILVADLSWLCAFDKSSDQRTRETLIMISKCVLDIMLSLKPEVSQTKCFVCDKKSTYETDNLSIARLDDVSNRFSGGSVHYMVKLKDHDKVGLMSYIHELKKIGGYRGWYRDGGKLRHEYIVYTDAKPIMREKFAPVC
uniref:p2 n=1 Tax=Tenuivirus oryzabrevis TaxID=3052762 RepID=A0A0R5NGJ3_9VIRU|nr:P2 [Tenuivirus oryzabrevis]